MYPSPTAPWHGAFVAEQVRSLRDVGLNVDVLFLDSQRSRLVYAWGAVTVGRVLTRSGYDVVHAHHTYALLFTDLARVVSRRGLPAVLTSHEGEVLDTDGTTMTWHPTSRLRHSLRLKRFAASRADHVIFVSSKLAERVGAKRFDVIPCGVDLDRFRPVERRAARVQLGLEVSRPIVFFPARRRGRGKRFTLALDAFNLLRAREAEAILLTGGDLPHQLMPLYYNAADVVLQASYYEASPTVVKEALACEAPVVSTDSGDTSSIVAGIENCWICPADAEAMAEAMMKVLGKRAVGARQALRERGLGLDQVAHRVAAVYAKVVSYEAPS